MAIRSCTVLLFVLASCHAASNSAKQAPRPEKMELKAAKQEIAELKLTIKGMAEAMAQDGGAMSPDVKSGMRDTADQAEQEHDGAREGLASSRSLLGAAKADGTCPEGKILSARNFKVLKNGTKVPGGMCVPLPKLEDFKIGAEDFKLGYGAPAGVLCSDSGCRTCAGKKCDTSQSVNDWVNMNGATKPADKVACSRICLMGGSLTEVKDLRRYDNPKSKTGERKVDSRFTTKKLVIGRRILGKKRIHRKKAWRRRRRRRQKAKAKRRVIQPVAPPHKHSSAGATIGGGMSSPICSLYKTTMCTNSTNCDVHKEVSCVAIVPGSIGVGRYIGGGSSAQLAAYRNECKHAINPCGSLPMLV